MTQRNKNTNDDLERRILEPVPARASTGQQPASNQSISTTRRAGQTAHQAKQKVSEGGHQAEQKAAPAIDQAKQQASSQAASQKQRAAHSLENMAQAIRHSSDELRNQDQPSMAHYTDKAAQQIERVSSYIKDKSLSDLMGDAERYARREPALFLGGAFLLGLLGARFLKSSSHPQQSSARSTPSNQAGARQAGTTSAIRF